MDWPVDDRLGGAPANVACGLARLGTPVAFAGRLGQDAIGEAFSRLFAERGVNTELLQRDAERPSRIVLVRRSLEGERQFQGFAGDEGVGFADQALEPVALPQARWLLIGSLPLAAPTSASALLSAVHQARRLATAIALDVNWRPTFWDPAADPATGPDSKALAAIQPLLQSIHLNVVGRRHQNGVGIKHAFFCAVAAGDGVGAAQQCINQLLDSIDLLWGMHAPAAVLHRFKHQALPWV